VHSSNRRCKPFWPLLTLLLLAGRSPAAPSGSSPPDPARQPGAADERPKAFVQKPAWKWTVTERMAKRFDSEAMATRVRRRADEHKALHDLYPPSDDDPLFKVDDQTNPPTDVIDGKRTPELFFTQELFTYLLDDGFPPDELRVRESRGPIESRAVALGFGQDLWPRLEKAAAPFLALRREAERLHISQPSSPAEALRWCRARAQAIAAAKAEFGEEPFLRLLYEAVAPNKTAFFFSPPAPDLARHLRYMEGGCQ
jgi:hypothetical protein